MAPTTRRQQREAAAAVPRPAANAGPRNQTTVAAARSCPRNQTATAVAAAPSGSRNQTVVAAATGQAQARNRRALGDIRNHVNAPVVDRLVVETVILESEKAQREAQVQQVTEENGKVMEENVRLRAMLNKKKALLQAMSEQCKFMALNHHN